MKSVALSCYVRGWIDEFVEPGNSDLGCQTVADAEHGLLSIKDRAQYYLVDVLKAYQVGHFT